MIIIIYALVIVSFSAEPGHGCSIFPPGTVQPDCGQSCTLFCQRHLKVIASCPLSDFRGADTLLALPL